MKDSFALESLERRISLSSSGADQSGFIDLPELLQHGGGPAKFVSMGHISARELDLLSSSTNQARTADGDNVGEESAFLDQPELAAVGIRHAEFVSMGHISGRELDLLSSSTNQAQTDDGNNAAEDFAFLDQPELAALGLGHAEFVSMGHTSISEIEVARVPTQPSRVLVSQNSESSGFDWLDNSDNLEAVIS